MFAVLLLASALGIFTSHIVFKVISIGILMFIGILVITSRNESKEVVSEMKCPFCNGDKTIMIGQASTPCPICEGKGWVQIGEPIEIRGTWMPDADTLRDRSDNPKDWMPK